MIVAGHHEYSLCSVISYVLSLEKYSEVIFVFALPAVFSHRARPHLLGSVRVNALDWPRALTHRTRETAVCMPVCMPHARICPLACFPFLLIRPTVSFLPYFFLSILLYTQHYSAPFLLHFFASSSSLSCACGIHKYGR